MAQLIDKDALLAKIIKRRDAALTRQHNLKSIGQESVLNEMIANELNLIISLINTLEVKEVDLDLITDWFDHIAQIADDRMTLTNQRMTDAHALDEIKCLAKNSSEFITKHYKAQKGK